MRKQIIIVVLLSFLVLLFTAATVSCLTNDVAHTAGYCTEEQGNRKTNETLWDVITRQLIGAVSLGL